MSHRSTSRLRKIIAATAATAASALLLTLAPTSASASTTCASSTCLINLEMQRSGISTSFTFDTTVPTRDTVRIYRGATLVATGLDPTWRSHHVLSSPATLTPNTAYTWHLTTTDQAGNVQERIGQVTTMHRRVDVLFNTIWVLNDSDASGPGEFKTRYKVGTSTAPSWMVPTSIASNSTVLATQILSMTDSGDTTKIRTEMYDTDLFDLYDSTHMIWTGYDTHPAWTSGSTNAADWSTASTTLDTRAETKTFKPFQMNVSSSVVFVVKGQYMVSYY